MAAMGSRSICARLVRTGQCESAPKTRSASIRGAVMTEEEMALKYIRDGIGARPEHERVRIAIIAQSFRTILKAEPICGSMALALVGAELAVQVEQVNG